MEFLLKIVFASPISQKYMDFSDKMFHVHFEYINN